MGAAYTSIGAGIVTAAIAVAALTSCEPRRITDLESRVAVLEAELDELKRAAAARTPNAPAPAPTAVPVARAVPPARPAPAAKPAPAPAAKPATPAKPVAEPAPKPAAKPAPKPAAKPAPKLAAKPASKPVAKPAPESAAAGGTPKAMGEGVCAGMAKVVRRDDTVFYIDKCEYPGKGKPKGNVTFEEAEKLCQERGARICRDTELERACQGTGGLTYPYGVDYEESFCHLPQRASRSAVVGSNKYCKSIPWEVYDLVGNVAEWAVSDEGAVSCGGSFWTAQGDSATCRRTYCSETSRPRWSFIGFRCCADSSP